MRRWRPRSGRRRRAAPSSPWPARPPKSAREPVRVPCVVLSRGYSRQANRGHCRKSNTKEPDDEGATRSTVTQTEGPFTSPLRRVKRPAPPTRARVAQEKFFSTRTNAEKARIEQQGREE